MIHKAQAEFGISRKIIQANEGRDLKQFICEQKHRKITPELKYLVQRFFQQDDVSRATVGKKETVTRGKVKKQKRFLLEPVTSLHKRFLETLTPPHTVSLSVFYKLKPFWIIKARIQDRETFLCKLHENCNHLVDRLRQLGYTSESTPALLYQIVCPGIKSKRMLLQGVSTMQR
jgi:hypothetical protein